ncbi:MAG TPA: bifunctional [glutamine synthetase] adenylyltransferase/[glutamine synthetase]-adenylyl-L-tyrosine phosphorylase, partial [Stellaceae bacterium]|nr:bifunctional [glutamine synthetase] adenylyltransferase/[glutamine synthetase]-adenylyl-L-tyrosine phosphorylase [Stellaceae bacterium]
MAFVNTETPSDLPRPADPAQLEVELGRWAEAATHMPDRALGQAMLDAVATASTRIRLEAIFGNSPFLTRLALREPELVTAVLRSGPQESFAQVIRSLNLDHVQEPGNSTPISGMDTVQVARRLRDAKRHAALIIAMADLADQWSLDQVTGALSRFAEATLQVALHHLVRVAIAAGQLAPAEDGSEGDQAGIIILGMGKLGAHELNYSSDVDLMILFDADRLRYIGRDTPQAFMARLARDLVRLMEERTADGYVFRTDLRLRPDPASTPPAVSLAAAETYYGSMGQNWERAAMIKARPVAGDLAAGRRFLASLAPFIWRKHLDFAAIRDIHSIKRQIDARHGGSLADLAGHNIKLGRGGIREIEFFVQTQQLIWGGRVPALRTAGTIETLAGLAMVGRIDGSVAIDLAAAYTALRRIEHRLQMIDDSQTHSLPTDAEGMRRLALFSGYPDTPALETALQAELGRVQRHYAELFRDAPSLSGPGSLVFTGRDDDPETLDTLARLGFAEPARVSETIRGWHHGRLRATRSMRARELLTELVPVLLAALSRTGNPDFAFARFDEFLGRLPASVQLFSLFQHHAEVLDLLAQILGEAPQLGRQLSRTPELLDAVLAPGFFDPLPIAADFSVDALRADLDNVLTRARDYEDVLDLTRRWTTDMRFRVGVQLLEGYLDGSGSGLHLAAIAETVLRELLPRVAADLARMHGTVPGGEVAILAFGKLGSREMTAASDLDLVLIY